MIEKVLEGYLTETKAKSKRWFVLYRRDNYPYLRYYKRLPRNANDRPLFDYPLTNISTVVRSQQDKPKLFSLLLDENNCLHLRADSSENALVWISTIEDEFKQKHLSQDTSASDYESTNYAKVANVNNLQMAQPTTSNLNTGSVAYKANTNDLIGLAPNPDPPPYDFCVDPIIVKNFHGSVIRRSSLTEIVKAPKMSPPRLIITSETYSLHPNESCRLIKTQTGSSMEIKTRSLKCLSDADRFGPVFRVVHLLHEQIANPGGIAVRGSVTDFRQALAVVDCDKRVWVAGWKSGCIGIHGLFHIGDQVMELGQIPVHNSKQFYDSLEMLQKQCKGLAVRCSLRLRRLPLGKLFAVRRVQPGQNIGLRLLEGTNQVVQVDPRGLAGQIGLPQNARSYKKSDSDGVSHTWTVTEVNGQTLNLFSDRNEATILLNAYGDEVTVVVHPTDFIKEIKRKLSKFRKSEQFSPQ